MHSFKELESFCAALEQRLKTPERLLGELSRLAHANTPLLQDYGERLTRIEEQVAASPNAKEIAAVIQEVRQLRAVVSALATFLKAQS